MFKCPFCQDFDACTIYEDQDPGFNCCVNFNPHLPRRFEFGVYVPRFTTATEIVKSRLDKYYSQLNKRGTGRTYNKLGQAVEMAREFPRQNFYFISASMEHCLYAKNMVHEHWGSTPLNLRYIPSAATQLMAPGLCILRSTVFIDHYVYESQLDRLHFILAHLK